MATQILNSSQKNSLEVTLRSFEQNLIQIYNCLDAGNQNGILFNRVNPLTREQRLEIHQKISAALAQIACLKAKLNLEAETETLTAYIRGLMSTDWEGLLDSQAQKLERFGNVAPEVASMIDPPLQFLADIALSLSYISEGNPFRTIQNQRLKECRNVYCD